MPRTPEGKVKDAVKLLLQQHRAYYFMPVMGGYGRSGIPDIIACVRGKFVGIECKAGYNKPTPLQEKELREIQFAGGTSIVVREDTLDELATALEKL